nr:putative reverse transcriptase domain-containing protein [Tanacetum cinerariifolium]
MLIKGVSLLNSKLETKCYLRYLYGREWYDLVRKESWHHDVQVPLDEIEIDENLHFVEEPIEIVERDVKKLKQRRIPLVKVRWNSRQGAENTWKREDQFPWERFNDLLRACPHHGFSELHQLDTFYNALNVNDQDSLNSAAGGNFLDKMPRECLKIIESKSKVRQSRAKAVVAKDMVKALLLDKKNQSPAPTPSTIPTPVKAVEPNCVTCGGAHSYQNCPATQENAYRDNIQEYVSQAAAVNYNQGNTGFRPQMVANQS